MRYFKHRRGDNILSNCVHFGSSAAEELKSERIVYAFLKLLIEVLIVFISIK